MNRITIIGNLTSDPVKRVTSTQKEVAQFTVAVNGRNETTYFACTAWEKLGENCCNYLHKGSKVCVVGQIGAHAYTSRNGEVHAQLDLLAREVEFLSSRDSGRDSERDSGTGFEKIEPEQDLPF